jgi:hypothetical protein
MAILVSLFVFGCTVRAILVSDLTASDPNGKYIDHSTGND